MKTQLVEIIEQSVHKVLESVARNDVAVPVITLDTPRNPEHGDFATNIALVLAKPLGQKPRELATEIVNRLKSSPLLDAVEIAGPGFINLRIATTAFMGVIAEILAAGSNYGRQTSGGGKKIQIEYVSANPTGPLHVGHGRGAAYGAVLANLFSAVGYDVTREYYVNDAGRQMDILATSVLMRYAQECGVAVQLPENAYQGDYIIDLARELRATSADEFLFDFELTPDSVSDDLEAQLDQLIAAAKIKLGETRYKKVHRFARDEILGQIKTDLLAFGVEFDHWYPESSLTENDAIEAAVTTLDGAGRIYNKDGAKWFKSTDFGDEKDRVVVRENGSATYFASDIAYHDDKYARGFDAMINIWGADHHGYIARVKAAIAALGRDPEKLEILLVQFAALFRNGEKVAMSTRSGEFVTLAELIDDVGRDAARFFYITRRSEQHLDFDLDLAKSQSNDNPVYYVQYAHARICSVVNKMAAAGHNVDPQAGIVHTEVLMEPQEKQLAVDLARYPEVLDSAVRFREPHQIATYLRELAAGFQGFYHRCPIITDDEHLRNARLSLICAVRQVIANGLDLLGVSAPEAM